MFLQRRTEYSAETAKEEEKKKDMEEEAESVRLQGLVSEKWRHLYLTVKPVKWFKARADVIVAFCKASPELGPLHPEMADWLTHAILPFEKNKPSSALHNNERERLYRVIDVLTPFLVEHALAK